MINRKKTRSMRLLALLLPVVILAASPGALEAQTCPELNQVPDKLKENVGYIHQNLVTTQSRSLEALTAFEGLLNAKKVMPEVDLSDAFVSILVQQIVTGTNKLVGHEESSFQSLGSIIQKPLVEILEIQNKNRAARDSRKQRSVKDWITQQRIILSETYDFNTIVTKLQCSYAKHYINDVPESLRPLYVNHLYEYAFVIGDSIKSINEFVIEYIEHFVNSTFDGDFESGGFLVARVEYNDVTAGVAIKSLKIASPAFSQQIGHGLNKYLAAPKIQKKPFDLKVRKLILFHDKDYSDYLQSGMEYAKDKMELASNPQTACVGTDKCIAAAFLKENNEISMRPIPNSQASSKLDSLKNENFSVFGQFTD